jgi:hypothetical protein
VGIQNFAHPEKGCQWMGLAGQVLDMEELPLTDLIVEVGGTLNDIPVMGLAVTGKAETYGPGGYEIKLWDSPLASDGTVWAQVFDLEGKPISSQIYFPTYDACEQNLILLNFVQSYMLPDNWVYLPLIQNSKSKP